MKIKGKLTPSHRRVGCSRTFYISLLFRCSNSPTMPALLRCQPARFFSYSTSLIYIVTLFTLHYFNFQLCSLFQLLWIDRGAPIDGSLSRSMLRNLENSGKIRKISLDWKVNFGGNRTVSMDIKRENSLLLFFSLHLFIGGVYARHPTYFISFPGLNSFFTLRMSW